MDEQKFESIKKIWVELIKKLNEDELVELILYMEGTSEQIGAKANAILTKFTENNANFLLKKLGLILNMNSSIESMNPFESLINLPDSTDKVLDKINLFSEYGTYLSPDVIEKFLESLIYYIESSLIHNDNEDEKNDFDTEFYEIKEKWDTYDVIFDDEKYELIELMEELEKIISEAFPREKPPKKIGKVDFSIITINDSISFVLSKIHNNETYGVSLCNIHLVDFTNSLFEYFEQDKFVKNPQFDEEFTELRYKYTSDEDIDVFEIIEKFEPLIKKYNLK